MKTTRIWTFLSPILFALLALILALTGDELWALVFLVTAVVVAVGTLRLRGKP